MGSEVKDTFATARIADLRSTGGNQDVYERPVPWTESKKDQQIDEGYKLVQSSQHLLVEFQEGSAARPPNWTTSKKMYNAIVVFLVAINSGISTSLPSSAVPAIMQDFNQSGDMLKSLPTAVFLVGYVVGSLATSPLSEKIGRKPVLLCSFTTFLLATLACSLSPNWTFLIVFRAICGFAGAAPQTVVGGVYADMFTDARTRGRAMVSYMSAGSFGPVVGPIISGCSLQYGWRWTFRISLIMMGITWLAFLFTSETFESVLLKQQASRLRKKWGCNWIMARGELQSDSAFSTTQILTRPITMLLYEPIVLSTAVYTAVAYSLVFFYFQAYPIIFEGIYGFDIKSTSLTYIPIGIGASFSGLITFYFDTIYERNKKQGKSWTSSPELHRLPLSCVSGPCLTVSIFWLAWTAKSDISWVVPVLSGLIFGFGYQVVFTSLSTYVTDAYKTYSASALAASVIVRSTAGALLPLAADPLYNSLGVSWATSVFGFVSLACIPIPFLLLYYGSSIRERSPFCQRLLEAENSGSGSDSESSPSRSESTV